MKLLYTTTIILILICSNQLKASSSDNNILSFSQKSITEASPYEYKVPNEYNSQIKEIGFSFWIKASYSSPGLFNFHNLHNGWPAIAGISDKNNDYCSTALRHRFLGMWLSNAQQMDNSPHYLFTSYQKTNSNRYRYMKFPYGREDFDHSWNFVSFSYSFEENQAVAAVHFGTSKQVRIFSFNHNYKYEPQDLNFRIGQCNDNSNQAFQGYYHDVSFRFSTESNSGIHISNENDLIFYMNSRPEPYDTALEYQRVQLTSSILTTELLNTNEHKWNFGHLNGIKEYAVWGWAKWEHIQHKHPWHLIYRLSNHKESDVQNYSKIGDRTLAAWVGRGFLHFSTYDFDYYGGHRTNLAKNIYLDNEDLHKWFFIYHGHSFLEHKTVAFVHLDSKDQRMEWNDNWHYLPDQTTFQLGKDQFYPSFSGQMKDWEIALGDGAFREYYFDDVCGDECLQYEENQVYLVEPEAPAPRLLQSQQKDKRPIFQHEVPEHELSDVQDTSFSFWFRHDFFSSGEFDLNALENTYVPIATLSETGDDSVSQYSRKQSVWFNPLKYSPSMVYTTYDKKSQNWNYHKSMPFESPKDFDSSWNFMYYGYSQESHKLFAYVYFGKTQAVQTLSFPEMTHNEQFNKLVFKVGQSEQYPYAFNGHFWNVRFYYKGQSYLGSQEAVEYYMYSSKKPQLLPSYIQYRCIQLVKDETYFSASKEDRLVSVGPIQGVEGAEEYAIHGWFKWEPMENKKAWHIMFRYTNFDKDSYGNIGFGQRDLSCWVGNGYLHFASYNYQVNSQRKVWNWTRNIAYTEEDLEKWFFVYMGYSHQKSRVVLHVEYDSKQEVQFLDNINHPLPYQPYVYVGHDKYHHGFNGHARNVQVSFGTGAYQEHQYEVLQY